MVTEPWSTDRASRRCDEADVLLRIQRLPVHLYEGLPRHRTSNDARSRDRILRHISLGMADQRPAIATAIVVPVDSAGEKASGGVALAANFLIKRDHVLLQQCPNPHRAGRDPGARISSLHRSAHRVPSKPNQGLKSGFDRSRPGRIGQPKNGGQVQ